MAEEWGTVIFKADKEIIDLFTGSDQLIALKNILSNCDSDIEDIDKRNLDFENLEVQKGYAFFTFSGADWLDISLNIVKCGKNIEWYSRISDDYGCVYFYALKPGGDNVGFSVETGGDYCEIEGYEEESLEKIENWKATLPDELKSTFPDFIDTDGIDFDGP